MACCPAHDDRNPSLSITLKGTKILVHCFSRGCTFDEIRIALGLGVLDFFTDAPKTARRLCRPLDMRNWERDRLMTAYGLSERSAQALVEVREARRSAR